ncbi:Primosomal protein N' (Replication factor Y)-superfamily II helicase OS=Lysinibacillus sphaericus OX=1421 GN=LS41612_12820 PE=4 SV=1 [Lysinibacillus sphaericus]
MVNGQTGRVGGDAPISPLRVTIAVLVSLMIAAVVWYFFMNE